jgi:hypothetical protein
LPRLLQFLNGSNVLTPQLFVELMHPLDELRRHLRGRFDVGRRYRFGVGIYLSLRLNL